MSAFAALARSPRAFVARRDPHQALIAALGIRLPFAMLAESRRIAWASLTFTGARHELRYLIAEGDAAAARAAAAALDAVEFELAGHFVAEIVGTFDPATGTLAIEALTVEAD